MLRPISAIIRPVAELENCSSLEDRATLESKLSTLYRCVLLCPCLINVVVIILWLSFFLAL